MNHIYVAFYTKDSPYEKEIEKLIETLEQFNLDYVIKDYKCRKDWLKNIHYKPICILDTMNKYPDKNIVYTDADSIIKQMPDLFFNTKADFMAHIRKDRVNNRLFINGEMLSGTLYFANNERVKRFVEKWVDQSNRYIGKITEQHLLQMMYNDGTLTKMGIKGKLLPAEYCCIPLLMKDIVPVIEHHQLSRVTRKLFKVKSKVKKRKNKKKKVVKTKTTVVEKPTVKQVEKIIVKEKETVQKPFVRRFL